MYRLNLLEGKYTILLSNDCKTFKALRHGTEYRDLVGDNLVLSLVQKIQDLEFSLYNAMPLTPCCHSSKDKIGYNKYTGHMQCIKCGKIFKIAMEG